jgi:regulator of sigma E protease
MSNFLFVLGIFLFICLIIVHEFGHFIVARRNKVKVEEFGLFFPPRIWSKKMKSGYDLSFNALPLGGFVRLKGEHDADTGMGSFGQASLWAKTKIMLAGVSMNLFVAFIIFTFLALVGMPQIIPNQFTISSDAKTPSQNILVQDVESNSPASAIGLKTGYTLVSIGRVNGQPQKINNPSNLPDITKSYAGKVVQVKYLNKQGESISKDVTLRSNQEVSASLTTKNPIGYLGISTTDSSNGFVIQKSTWSAPLVALGLMKQITVLTFQGIGHALQSIFAGHPSQAGKSINGPVGVVRILKNSSDLGYQFVLFVVALISLSLALINVLPIPALDGGRLFFTLVPRIIKGKPIKQRTEELINAGGLAFLFLLIIIITVNDIKNF